MKIAVIGGGAAGLMTVATLHDLSPEAEIFLIERNSSLGKKVLASRALASGISAKKSGGYKLKKSTNNAILVL